MPDPVLSVIVLGHNDRRYIESCLSAALDQTLPSSEYEIVYADNGSDDGSAALARERFPAVRTVRFDRNLGFAAGNNRAAEHARARFLLFVNLDIVLHRDCLRAIASHMMNGAVACQANQLMPWHREYEGLDRVRYPARAYFADITPWGFVEYREAPMSPAPIPVRFLSGACFAIDRQVIADLGYLFDERFFFYAEDLDLSLRLSALGCELAVVPGAVAYHQHPARKLRGRDVARAYRATRNRLLAYYKTTEPAAFRRLLPRLVLGAPLKVFQVGRNQVRQGVLCLAMVPVVAAASCAALLASGRYRNERQVWCRRKREASARGTARLSKHLSVE